MNSKEFEFPQLLLHDLLNQNSKIDNRLEKLYMEASIIAEQRSIQDRLRVELSVNNITMMTPDGRRLMTQSEVMTQIRICDATAWQSKQNIEKLLEELVQFVGVKAAGSDSVLLSDKEHNDLAMGLIKKCAKNGINLFQSNRTSLIKKMIE
jgi:hypothetical protein